MIRSLTDGTRLPPIPPHFGSSGGAVSQEENQPSPRHYPTGSSSGSSKSGQSSACIQNSFRTFYFSLSVCSPFVLLFLYRPPSFSSPAQSWCCLWMTSERTELTPGQQAIKARELTPYTPARETRAQRSRRLETGDKETSSAESDTTVRAGLSEEDLVLPFESSTSPISSSSGSRVGSPQIVRAHSTDIVERLSTSLANTSTPNMTNESQTDKLTRLITVMVAESIEARKEAKENEARRLAIQREDDQRREERLLLALRDARPAVPQSIIVQSQKLPEMKESDDVESFIELFEAALRANDIAPELWKRKLHAQLPNNVKVRIQWVVQDDGSTYEQVKEALLGCAEVTFNVAAEAFKTAERGKLTSMTPRLAADKMRRWACKITQGATSELECRELLVMAEMRHWLVPELKTYVDLARVRDLREFVKVVEGWESSQPSGTPCFRQITQNPQSNPPHSSRYSPYQPKRSPTCYHCGKVGHISKDCRSQIAAERTPPTPSVIRPPVKAETQVPARQVTVPGGSRPATREVTCFSCHQKGHKSPQCPQKHVKRIQIPADDLVSLRDNELMGLLGPHLLPITCDSGADITVVPEECVPQESFTGEVCEVSAFNKVTSSGRVCDVVIDIAGRRFPRRAVAQPGESLAWTACLSVPYAARDDREYVAAEMDKKFSKTADQLRYWPPKKVGGVVRSALMVGEGTVVAPTRTITCNQVASPVEDERDAEPVADSIGSFLRMAEESTQREGVVDTLVVEEGSSVSVEEGGGSLEGGAEEKEGEVGVLLEGISHEVPDLTLAKATASDPSLAPARQLADIQKEGYRWKNGTILRTRVDLFGDSVEQVCVPQPFRNKCLQMAHTRFGHQGRNKMVTLLRPMFYWPSLSKDCMAFIRACKCCQLRDKSRPSNNPMQLRELTSVPFEKMAVDIVGPFPTAVGGFRFLLTAIDLATRWPEAIPLRTTTANVVTTQLTGIFSRTGFPTSLTTDNGPQFKGKVFKAWLKKHGIAHVVSSPYHPQGNGVVERLHRTLNSMIGKLCECKGNWAKVVPMCLYFLRSTPCSATGMSPFMARQGWEPATPLRLLYRVWSEQDVGNVDLDEWVVLNGERIEAIRDSTMAAKVSVAAKRKSRWDCKAKERTFRVGDRVLIRKPGMSLKLEETWEGPFVISRVNSPLSYGVDLGDRKVPSMHVSLLKRFIEVPVSSQTCEIEPRVSRVTSVLEPDSPGDEITDRLAEVQVEGDALSPSQKADISLIESTFSDILTKSPGLTDLVQFELDTGDHQPIFQRAYNTPTALKESIDKELDWLLEKGFIRPSTSPWASPLVAVKKPDGTTRLCVDYRRINDITRQIPFYMPRVEEVLEGVGQARYISKLDLSKGYYQIPVKESDTTKTTFICHRGRFQFTRMPFGVKNAPAIFQELMQGVLKNCTDFSTAYMDDVVIYSHSWTDHVKHINRVLTALRKANLTVNPTKCVWGGKTMLFLGHQVGDGRMSLPAHRAEALAKYQLPSTKRGLRAFLGSVGFYRRYSKQLAAQTAILTPLTSKQAPPRIVWDERGKRAFHTITCSMSRVCSLCIPLPQDTFSLVTDASGLGIGGVLQVRRHGSWEAAAYFSRQLRGPEQRYSATELEALAVVESINHFNYYLYGRAFCVFTDHKPLLQLLTSEHLNPRLRRFAYKLQHWLVKIQYLPGIENSLADALSREERRGIAETPVGQPEDFPPVVGPLVGDVEDQPPQRRQRSVGGTAPPT